MSVDTALALIESVKDYHVLFIGDTIVDEYHYVTALGKSPKEHLISTAYHDKEVFRGGVEAAANHLRSFCASVDLLQSRVVTRKIRFVDKVYVRKLFEVQYQDEIETGVIPDSEYDVTVVTDFGHGFITPERTSSMKAVFLAVNAQTNSSNIGFNLITKYPKADYIVIDEPEARLAAQDRDSSIEDVILKLARGRCDKFVVTHGTHGAYGYDHGRFYHQPAFTDKVTDTMGAGDAFFAITAPMAKTGSMDDLLFIGNAAGALKTQIVGHRKSVTKEALCEFIRTR